MKKTKRKGFTIVELVIVVAVIAILSAILIPTFSGLVKNAKATALQENLRNAYTEYAVDAAANGSVIETQYLIFQDKDTEVGYTYNEEDKKFEVLEWTEASLSFEDVDEYFLPFFETSKYKVYTELDMGDTELVWTIIMKLLGVDVNNEAEKEEYFVTNMTADWTTSVDYILCYEFGDYKGYYLTETDAETGDSRIIVENNDSVVSELTLIEEETIDFSTIDYIWDCYETRVPNLHFKLYNYV